MDEYIKREAVIDRLKRNLDACNPGSFSELCYRDAIETVKCFPAADVAPVVHGLWVCVNKIDPISGYRCSKCRHIVGFDLTPYCPNCGAKMDGGDSNEADLCGRIRVLV